MKISNFIKRNTSICICTLGLAIVGYMGYHAVRWIINKCQSIAKINQIANKNFKKLALPSASQAISSKTPPLIRISKEDADFRSSPGSEKIDRVPATIPVIISQNKQLSEVLVSPREKTPVSTEGNLCPGMQVTDQTCHKRSIVFSGNKSIHKMNEISKAPKSFVNRMSHMDITDGKVNMGQGEYIVFHQLSSGEKKEVERETYKQVYMILNRYAPAAIIQSHSDRAMEICEKRYEIIKSKIKEIDPTLEVIFVPRTLYELIFIRKCIREDIKNNKICSQLSPANYYKNVTIENFEGDQKEFESFQENRIRGILKEKKCWHLCYFDDVGDTKHPGVREVAYRLNRVVVKTLLPPADGFTYDELCTKTEKEIEFLKLHYHRIDSPSHCQYPGPTTNFNGESTRGTIRSMGIRDDKDAQIIRAAIAIDCSKVARRAFFLYRGGNFQKDAVICRNDKEKPYSLSFGSSLFAGSLYDGGATAFYFMREGVNAYAIPVPFDQITCSPFFIPQTHTLAQLFGHGEIFHGRTRAWKVDTLTEIGGIAEVKYIPDHLKSELSKEELLTQFQDYKNQAIQLK